jgi:cytochrome c peroxidase
LLLEERWSPKVTHNGKPWAGPDQFEDSTGKLMMLPSDMVLIAEPAFRKWVEIFAKDEDKFFKVSLRLDCSVICHFSLD